MRDQDCVAFLQWALPQLRMRWTGFRKVRAQVCKRLARRLRELELENHTAYQHRLENTADEWPVLDALCRVSVSRFYRDKMLFAFLECEVLPELAQRALARGERCLKVWSAGCGSGEEPYTVAILWTLQLQSQFPTLQLQVLASDADPRLCRRARQACYPWSAVKNLPAEWRVRVFAEQDGQFCLKTEYLQLVRFTQQDIRSATPDGCFDLLLCRNLVFTYLVEEQQQEILARLRTVLQPGGALVTGIHENLPAGSTGFTAWSEKLRIYRRQD